MNTTTTPTPTPAPDDDEDFSLKSFLLAAVLWLPLAFFVWYALRSGVVFPVVRGVAWLLTHWMPDVVGSIEQERETMVLITRIIAPGQVGPNGEVGMLSQDYNPLQFCYGLPVLVGLIMATPLDWTRTFKQLAIGYVLLLPAQIFGLSGEVLRDLSYSMGDDVAAMVAAHGLSQYAVALWYQFGYLILPAVMPVVIWVLLNRAFIESLRLPGPPRAEPRPAAGGHSPVNKDTPAP